MTEALTGERAALPGTDAEIWTVQYSASGQELACGCSNGLLRVLSGGELFACALFGLSLASRSRCTAESVDMTRGGGCVKRASSSR